jgi:hypothetical protein
MRHPVDERAALGSRLWLRFGQGASYNHCQSTTAATTLGTIDTRDSRGDAAMEMARQRATDLWQRNEKENLGARGICSVADA